MSHCLNPVQVTNWFSPPIPPYGKERRKQIKDWFIANPTGGMAVNCKYRPQLKSDPDFRRLVKEGWLVMVREGGRYGKHQFKYPGKRRSILVMAQK